MPHDGDTGSDTPELHGAAPFVMLKLIHPLVGKVWGMALRRWWHLLVLENNWQDLSYDGCAYSPFCDLLWTCLQPSASGPVQWLYNSLVFCGMGIGRHRCPGSICSNHPHFKCVMEVFWGSVVHRVRNTQITTNNVVQRNPWTCSLCTCSRNNHMCSCPWKGYWVYINSETLLRKIHLLTYLPP